MKKYFYLIILFSALITSCSSSDENPSQEIISPTISEIIMSEITNSSVVLSWTASVPNGTDLSFDVFLENVKVGENISTNTWSIGDLEELTSYSGKIIVSSSTGETTEKTFNFTTARAPDSSAFEISITNITTKSALVSWTKPIIDDSDVVYDMYLNDNLKQENLSATSFVLEELTPFEEYTLKIIAKTTTATTVNAEKTFKTLGTSPSSFPLTIENNGIWGDLDPYWLQIHWTPPTVEDGSDYSYAIYLDDVLVTNFITNTTSSWTFTSLEEGKTYTFKVVANAINETATEESITFTTRTYSELTDFEVEVLSFTSTSAIVDWTPSTDPDGSRVYYYVHLNGVQHHAPHTHVPNTVYSFDNLSPNTTYVVKIIAVKNSGLREKTLEKEITFTTNTREHPTLTVEKAVLYTPDSQYFGGQLNVKFSESIANMNITEFSAGNITIGNFIIYPSSISTGIFSSNDYNTIHSSKKGYVYITDNGETYKLDFDIVEETN